jgi:hypothetical protein
MYLLDIVTTYKPLLKITNMATIQTFEFTLQKLTDHFH